MTDVLYLTLIALLLLAMLDLMTGCFGGWLQRLINMQITKLPWRSLTEEEIQQATEHYDTLVREGVMEPGKAYDAFKKDVGAQYMDMKPPAFERFFATYYARQADRFDRRWPEYRDLNPWRKGASR